MARHRTAALLVLSMVLPSTAHAAATKPALAGKWAPIVALPADQKALQRTLNEVAADDEEGAELPASVWFARQPDDGTFMVVTDESLCKRASETAIRDAFRALVGGRRPALGEDITGSRIGGAGYATLYLALVDGVRLAGVDAQVAFLAGDTQDDPAVDPTLYVYALRGSNLLQLTASVGPCEFPVPESFWAATPEGKPAKSEAQQRSEAQDYYRRSCTTAKMMAKARAAGQKLVEIYRLTP